MFPLRILHALGTLFGWVTYLAAGGYRRRLAGNLALAFPGPSAARRWRAAAETGKAVLELPALWGRPPASAERLVREVRGWDAVEGALRGGHGVLLLSPHLGCFEMFGVFLHSRVRLTALYRPHKSAFIERLIGRGRGRLVSLAAAGTPGVRAVLAALRRGEAVFMLPDQVPGRGEGRWLPFFGRPAYTMTLAARLTEHARVSTFMVLGERLSRGQGFRLHFLVPPVPIEGSAEARARRINENVEALVRRLPEQYLWGYNRYKRPAGAEPPPPSGGAEAC